MKKLLLLFLFPLGASAQSTWTNCAQEGGACNLSESKYVRYGYAATNAWSAVRSAVGNVPCTNTFFGGDPAQGFGKECQSMDIPAGPPPITNPVPYWIMYTPPTLNTDGSPIKPIKKIYFQAAPTDQFLTNQTYTWESTTINGVYSVTNGPAGTYFWRAFVETDDGVSAATFPPIMTEKQYMASRAPKCEPLREGGDPNLATQMHFDLDLLGGAMYYACRLEDNTWAHYGVYGPYKWECISDTAKAFGMKLLGERQPALVDIWSRCVDAIPTPESLAYKPKWDALKAKYAPVASVPPATHKVKVNGTLSSRAAYAIVNGTRSGTIVGRVSVGAPCDCNSFKSGEFCSVSGQENLATAKIDQLTSAATQCELK